MPRKIFDEFFNTVKRDLENHYSEGSKYLSVRKLAEKFQVSVQTAQRAVKKLEELGCLSVKQRAGITVKSVRPLGKAGDYRIAVVSAREDTRFNRAFFKGIRETAGEKGINVSFEELPNIDTCSLRFGEYLLSLNVNGIIALYFSNSALPFYHVMREGLDIAADIIPDEFPGLPVVQTNNYRHAGEAGRIFLDNGYRRILVAGYYPQRKNRRFEGLYDAVKDFSGSIKYVCLTEFGAMNALDSFFNNFDSRCAVFSVDFSANYIVAAKFIQHEIRVKNDNFLVYDCEEDLFHYKGLSPVKRVAPSFFTLGAELCKILITKLETGAYPVPLQRKI
ncbi:MAG: GntR family transcriptional regulator [Treponema sp.]|jgi:DNA-binding LacI/PurR family transcriptional regulator|nr:GntR family transcriptional regulator [Treponema sp.]